MHTLSRALLGCLACSALLIGTVAAVADPIPALVNIPSGLDTRSAERLERQKRDLEGELLQFQSAARSFNAKPASAQSDAEFAALQTQRSHYIEAARAFNDAVGTQVVDARNVPSGLPKSVEAEIPNTPSGARVRKGFQAIMQHDWQVALAWFQDARNHEPGNAAIERLIELARFTLESEQVKSRSSVSPPRPATVKPLPQPVRAASGNTAADKLLDQQLDADLAAQLAHFNRIYVPAHPSAVPIDAMPRPWVTFIRSLFSRPQRTSRRPGSVSGVRD